MTVVITIIMIMILLLIIIIITLIINTTTVIVGLVLLDRIPQSQQMYCPARCRRVRSHPPVPVPLDAKL